MAASPVLDAAHSAFIQQGLSITLGARDDACRATLVRVVGCAVSPDRREVRLLFSARQGREVIERIGRNGAVAVVFSEPSSHRTIQLKAGDARVVPAEPADAELARRHADAFVAHLGALGYGESFVRNLLHVAPEDLVAVVFTPAAAFAQTPGPGAGGRLATAS